MFKNMKIGAKIVFSFIVILLLLAGIGLISYYSLNGLLENVENADDTNRIMKDVFSLQLQEKNYIIRQDQKYVTEQETIMQDLVNQANETKMKFKHAENKKQMDDILYAADAYEKAFKSYVKLNKNKSELDAKMVQAARAAIQLAEETRDAYKNELYSIILNGMNYMVRGGQEYIDRVHANVQLIIDISTEIPESTSNADSLVASIRDYQGAFDGYVELVEQQAAEEEKMLESARNMENACELAVADQKTKMENQSNSSIMMIIIVAALAILFGILLALILKRSITKPLVTLIGMSEKIARGDLDQQKLALKTKDELGTLYASFGEMVNTLKYKAEIVKRIAGGDLTAEIELASNNDGLGQSLKEMKRSLNEVLSEVNIAVEQVSAGSDQVSQSGQSLSQGATEQASALEEISSSLSEINSQSKQNAENATGANALAKKAVENAENGNQQMKELISAMERINESSDEIKKVVKVIDDIAFQINLLSLNANVEAARAGKHGKGFAVVAEEVRNLAVKSANAVKETAKMVEVSIKNIELGTMAAEETAKQLGEIEDGSSKVANFLGEIALASNEQAQGIEQINSGLEQIDQVTQSNTANAEQSAAATEELASQGQALKAMVARFKLAENGSGDGSGPGHEVVSKDLPQMDQEQKLVNDISQDRGIKTMEQKPVDPKEVIKLDDDDFDRF